ncbi:hypothetical protein GGTG_11251 [Gaeumannomyces tritici R3-111a-1]|uniref:Uncharacterized protein n=1 Tax=Gaeumannomyces tritici (strain R3-111a-1) TaxID=644352 RepID=J3PCN1_GAET3|nr:hypothetical protein GGTG_11251 [Gaeumannomyces tritici R3-111a-1]EJT72001.1 hypothetical protein GGTG_11251 [Gaeumannomyces tritici R3-111a-1]
MTSSLFSLPDELVFTALSQSFPCRDPQIRALATLLYPHAAPCRNLVVHGSEATGKSVVTEAVLERMTEDGADLAYAIVSSAECVTGRHLLETTIAKVATALRWPEPAGRCENLSQLTVELAKMIKGGGGPGVPDEDGSPDMSPEGWRFVLVFDGIDRQREAPPTMLPALARLSEIIPNLTTTFIMTCPPPGALKMTMVPHLHFPNYTKAEFIEILSSSPPPPVAGLDADAAADLWPRFVGPVYESLGRAAARTLPALQQACFTLWPRFTAPILAETHGPRELTRLLVAARAHLQDEKILAPGIIAAVHQPVPATEAAEGASEGSSTLPNGTSNGDIDKPSENDSTASAPTPTAAPERRVSVRGTTAAPEQPTAATDLSSLLPTTARLLLVSAYLASHNATKHDLTLFSTHYHGRRRRRGGLSGGTGGPRSKHRKIARRLLGAHAFVFERMLAIFVALRNEWAAGTNRDIDYHTKGAGSTVDGDVAMAVATLSSLRLLARVGGGDATDHGGRWRANVGWDVIRPLGRSMGIEVEDWLID